MTVSSSPIRQMASGFQRIAQLLCDELVRQMGQHETRKLVLFSDSRQDAAKLSTGIKTAHYLDTIRQVAFRTLAEQARLASEQAEERREIHERSREFVDLQRQLPSG